MSDAVTVPSEPTDEIDSLIDYLSERFPQRKKRLLEMFSEGKRIADPSLVIRLAYEAMEFRFELDEWLPFAKALLDAEYAEQLSVSHSERLEELREKKAGSRPSAELVKSQAEQFVAPLRRAYEELKHTHEFMGSVLSWCQSQGKMLRSEEYEALAQAAVAGAREAEGAGVGITRPPTIAGGLRRMRNGRARTSA